MSRPITVAFVGCGEVAMRYLPVYRDLPWVRVAACIDVDLARAAGRRLARRASAVGHGRLRGGFDRRDRRGGDQHAEPHTPRTGRSGASRRQADAAAKAHGRRGARCGGHRPLAQRIDADRRPLHELSRPTAFLRSSRDCRRGQVGRRDALLCPIDASRRHGVVQCGPARPLNLAILA